MARAVARATARGCWRLTALTPVGGSGLLGWLGGRRGGGRGGGGVRDSRRAPPGPCASRSRRTRASGGAAAAPGACWRAAPADRPRSSRAGRRRASSSSPSRTEFRISDSVPSVCASVTISACCGVTSSVAVWATGVGSGFSSPSAGPAGPRRWSNASTRMSEITVSLPRTAGAVVGRGGDGIGQDQVDAVAGQREAAQAGDLVDRDGDRAHALGEHGGEESPIARLHDGGPGDRNALRQHLACDAAGQVRGAGVVGDDHLPGDRVLGDLHRREAVGRDDRADGDLRRRDVDLLQLGTPLHHLRGRRQAAGPA